MEVTPPPPGASATLVSDADGAPPPPVHDQRSLVRNTVYLTAAQAATIPLAVITNALMGRYLGAEDFGYLYLAGTLCGFAVLALEWGQQGAVPALVARDRARAGAYLGSSLVWRLTMSVVAATGLSLVCYLLGYRSEQRWAVALVFPASIMISCAAGMKDTIRGFERTDIPALAHVGQQVLALALVVPILLFGGGLRAVLLINWVAPVLVLLYLYRSLRSVGVPGLSYERSALKSLFSFGTPFVFFDLAMVLLPNINATFLSKLAPAEVVGWYGVSQRLIGLIIFPASALIGALYPTLCRLQTEDKTEFARVTRNSLYGTMLLAVPAAVGCGMFPEIGVAVFGSGKFGGATQHLQVMSAFVFLVYFSMPLGTAILASNRQKAWALVQCLCILTSVCGNPFLIPYFQRVWGNGGVGTCVTLVVSEAIVVGCGIALAPRGIFNGELFKSLSLAALAGAAMALAAWITKPVSIFLAVPVALLAYAAVAYFSGAIQPSTLVMAKDFVNRKLRRRPA